jgi:hypothetical protein
LDLLLATTIVFMLAGFFGGVSITPTSSRTQFLFFFFFYVDPQSFSWLSNLDVSATIFFLLFQAFTKDPKSGRLTRVGLEQRYLSVFVLILMGCLWGWFRGDLWGFVQAFAAVIILGILVEPFLVLVVDSLAAPWNYLCHLVCSVPHHE